MALGPRSLNRRSVENRRCKACGRGMAMVNTEELVAKPGYWQDHLGEWHEGEPPWDRCPHGVVGGDVWCHHCDGEPF